MRTTNTIQHSYPYSTPPSLGLRNAILSLQRIVTLTNFVQYQKKVFGNFNENFSTQLLTVLTKCVIVCVETRKAILKRSARLPTTASGITAARLLQIRPTANADPTSAEQRPSGLLFWKQKSKGQYEISGVSQRYQLLNFIWDASTASGKNGGMTYDVTEHFWRKLI